MRGRKKEGRGKRQEGSLTMTVMVDSDDSMVEVSHMTMHSQLTKSRNVAPRKAMLALCVECGWVCDG